MAGKIERGKGATNGFSAVDRDGCLCVGSGPISPEIYSSNDLSAVIYDLIHIIDYMSISDGHQPSRAERKIKEARAILARIDGGGRIMARFHHFISHRGWDVCAAHGGFEAYNGAYDEAMWAATHPALIGMIDGYEAELDAAMVDAQAHLAAMTPGRRAMLEGEWL